MKHKTMIIFTFTLLICFFFLPSKVFASSTSSPSATLTVDGMQSFTYTSVQDAVEAVTNTTGNNFIIEIASGTVTEPLNIIQQPIKNVVIRPMSGATVTFTNTITIDGNGNLNNPETLLIQGLIFDFTSSAAENCIHFDLLRTSGYCYPHNITINGCTFRGVLGTTVAVKSATGGSRNIAIINCTGTALHSLAQLRAVSGYIFIQNTTISNSSGGVNFYGPANFLLDTSNFSVEGYAVRSGQTSSQAINTGYVIINNSILNSNSLEDGTIVLRSDSSDKIYIIHSNITNDSGGAILQNLNADREGGYNINIIESNTNGQITGIDLTTVTTIDDPNVENGPVTIANGSDIGSYIWALIILIIILLILLILNPVIIIFVYKKNCGHPFRKYHRGC